MKQIYTNSTEKVYLRIYKDGELFDADSAPTFSISIVGSSSPARTGTTVRESVGTYYFITDLDETLTEGTLKVDWAYTVLSDNLAKIDYVSVVTPYVNFMDIKLTLAPAGTTDEEIEHSEMFARYMIDNYTGTSFGLRDMSINLFGNDQKVLVLPHRLERLDSVAVNDEVLWTRDPAVNQLGRILSITDTNYGILSEKADEVPVWSDFNERAVWKKSYKYTINGQFGWADLPDEIEFCAKLLVDDYFCKETAWKKRFIEQINASDWRVVFNQKQFLGTGNFFADQILSRYKSIGMVIV
jgi:hypothetical protein